MIDTNKKFLFAYKHRKIKKLMKYSCFDFFYVVVSK